MSILTIEELNRMKNEIEKDEFKIKYIVVSDSIKESFIFNETILCIFYSDYLILKKQNLIISINNIKFFNDIKISFSLKKEGEKN